MKTILLGGRRNGETHELSDPLDTITFAVPERVLVGLVADETPIAAPRIATEVYEMVRIAMFGRLFVAHSLLGMDLRERDDRALELLVSDRAKGVMI